MGGATNNSRSRHNTATFQSTLPVGGATPLSLCIGAGRIISIHAPRGGSDDAQARYNRLVDISIHAPRGGSDDYHAGHCGHGRHFNPRSPWGERQGFAQQRHSTVYISIHAPRGGSDKGTSFHSGAADDFNPRSPWGERHSAIGFIKFTSNFNPRSPWGERLWPLIRRAWSFVNFNPRSPWGERRLRPNMSTCSPTFQSTLPVGGATSPLVSADLPGVLFQSTLPVGGATGSK